MGVKVNSVLRYSSQFLTGDEAPKSKGERQQNRVIKEKAMLLASIQIPSGDGGWKKIELHSSQRREQTRTPLPSAVETLEALVLTCNSRIYGSKLARGIGFYQRAADGAGDALRLYEENGWTDLAVANAIYAIRDYCEGKRADEEAELAMGRKLNDGTIRKRKDNSEPPVATKRNKLKKFIEKQKAAGVGRRDYRGKIREAGFDVCGTWAGKVIAAVYGPAQPKSK